MRSSKIRPGRRFAALAAAATLIAAALSIPADSGSDRAAAAEKLPTPASVFGWKPCTDYKLSDYDQITSYFKALDAASSRMTMIRIGDTSEGPRPIPRDHLRPGESHAAESRPLPEDLPAVGDVARKPDRRPGDATRGGR